MRHGAWCNSRPGIPEVPRASAAQGSGSSPQAPFSSGMGDPTPMPFETAEASRDRFPRQVNTPQGAQAAEPAARRTRFSSAGLPGRRHFTKRQRMARQTAWGLSPATGLAIAYFPALSLLRRSCEWKAALGAPCVQVTRRNPL